ncbi:MAG: hypothetical protein WBX78_06700, partial [Pseudolabrys sp.]
QDGHHDASVLSAVAIRDYRYSRGGSDTAFKRGTIRFRPKNGANDWLDSIRETKVYGDLNFCQRLSLAIFPFRRPMDTIKATQCVDVLPID